MIYLDNLLQATGGTLHGATGATEFTSFAFDSRRLEPGQLFLAVKTATGDGHDFIGDAIRRGAAGVLCEYPASLPDSITPVTTIIVPDLQQALSDYAACILQKYRPKVIGVTGSSGKTTAKEAIAAVLQKRYRVFKNFGSYNGRYGLPIALGELTPDHEVAVLEMACDSFGEIAELVRVTQPEIGVITAINQTHLAYLGTLANIANEKGRLIEALPFTGSAILNADDPRVAGMVPRTKARILTFGLSAGADVRAADLKMRPDGLTFTLHYEGRSYAGRAPLLGRHQVYPLLAAVTSGVVLDVPPEAALEALAKLPRVPGRLNPLPGQKGTLILDDTFNSSPEAAIAALDTLAELPGATKVAILGDMADLGEIEVEAHQQIGQYAATRVQRLVTQGDVAQQIATAAREAGLGKHAVHVTFTSDDAVAAVQDLLSPDTVVLVKGSASVRLERVVQKLLAQPDQDHRHLVRQGAGWEQVRARQPARPTWVEINLEAIANNVRLLTQMAAPAKIMAVLKADATATAWSKWPARR
jgi:alanine racemase